MTLKFALAAALLALPSVGLAAGCKYGKEQAMTCAEGTAYDHATKTCLPVST